MFCVTIRTKFHSYSWSSFGQEVGLSRNIQKRLPSNDAFISYNLYTECLTTEPENRVYGALTVKTVDYSKNARTSDLMTDCVTRQSAFCYLQEHAFAVLNISVILSVFLHYST
jgi:hypothetical protein